MLNRIVSFLCDLAVEPLMLMLSTFANNNKEPIIDYNSLPILLLHGLGSNQSCFFFLKKYLIFNNLINIYTLNMDDRTFDSKIEICEYIEKVEAKIDTICKKHNKKIIVIGHSIGGIIGGLVFKDSNKIDSLITLNSPWYGTDTVDLYDSYILPIKEKFGIPIINAARHALSPDSKLLKNLRENITDKQKYIFTIGSISDWIVHNKKTDTPFKIEATSKNCFFYSYRFHGHNSLLFCPLTFIKIKEWIFYKRNNF